MGPPNKAEEFDRLDVFASSSSSKYAWCGAVIGYARAAEKVVRWTLLGGVRAAVSVVVLAWWLANGSEFALGGRGLRGGWRRRLCPLDMVL